MTYTKTNIDWIRYEIDWFKMAKSSCKRCHGRGYEGYEVQSKEEDAMGVEPSKVLCECVVLKWTKMNDDERLKFATLKENADEIVSKAKEELLKVMEEVKSESEQ
jgi:hypothetical protein